MASLRYWTGTSWAIVPTGGGGGGTGTQGPPGPAGPAGPAGASVEVFGPQVPPPMPKRKGDVWLFSGVAFSPSRETDEDVVYLPESPEPVVNSLRETSGPTVLSLE